MKYFRKDDRTSIRPNGDVWSYDFRPNSILAGKITRVNLNVEAVCANTKPGCFG
jgi:hypothetical protein